jgi:hydrogenase expression/formation protein HypC
MCLAVPGRILSIAASTDASGDASSGSPFADRVAMVDFQGSQVEVSLQLVPAAQEGDWVLVHAGFALQTLDEAEAKELWEYLREAEVVSGIPGEEGGTPPES